MKKHFFSTILLVAFYVITAYAQDDLFIQRVQKQFKPIPASISDVKGKPLTPDKIELGKLLYFEPRLSASSLISCNTCHNVGMGGADFQETSVGHRWQKGPRNAPTVLNSVFNVAQFWDGRAANLKEQAKGPVQASAEISNSPEKVVETLKSMPEYIAFFKKVFPNDKDPISFDNMADAIEAFEATLLTPDSPFDKFLKGNKDALSASEKDGLKLFMDKGCVTCHRGINIGGTGYFPFGVVEKPRAEIMAGDQGRFKVPKSPGDEYVFKAPSLRNIDLTPPYFHSGKVWKLREAVSIMSSVQLGATLTDKEIDMVVTFLKSTTGVQPKVVYPILPAPTNKTPKPKLD